MDSFVLPAAALVLAPLTSSIDTVAAGLSVYASKVTVPSAPTVTTSASSDAISYSLPAVSPEAE